MSLLLVCCSIHCATFILFLNLTLNVHANVPDERSTSKYSSCAAHSTNTSTTDGKRKKNVILIRLNLTVP